MKIYIRTFFILLFLSLFIVTVNAQTYNWYTFGNGLGSPSYAVAVIDSIVYVGGSFGTAGGNQVNNIAKWDGNSWSPLGSGTNSDVNALAVIGNDLYAAGNFSSAGGAGASHIAKWDGSNWSSLGQGVNSTILCLFADGTDLYAGGFFTQAGGNSANRIAKWDGNSWQPLGYGFNNEVDVISVKDSIVYAGGIFSASGGNPIQSIAKWNGTNWSEIGGGLGGYVQAITFDQNNNMYVGGNFSKPGVGDWILRWDGSQWYNLANGVGGIVNCLKLSGNDLYVGGEFIIAGGHVSNHIAKFNLTSQTWSPIGNGVLYGGVIDLAIQTSKRSMVLAGSFYIADSSLQTNYIARFTDSENPLPVELSSFNAEVKNSDVILNWSTSTETNNLGFEIERMNKEDGRRKSAWKQIGFIKGSGTSTESNSYQFTDANLTNGNYSYKLVQVDYNGNKNESKIINIEVNPAASTFILEQNYPNPFNPVTSISYQIPESGFVSLKVYDTEGKEVQTLVNGFKKPGNYRINFNASNLSSGIYFYRISCNNFIQTKKMVLLK